MILFFFEIGYIFSNDIYFIKKNFSMIVFTNTMTQKKEVFNPSREGKVSMYVCGITPYDYPHIGHGRCYVTFDLVYRLLTFLGYDVTYARNFTDIDDKILTRASKELGDPLLYKEITKPYIKAFGSDMKQLNCKVPNFEPLVTEMIPQIIAFTQGLIQKGAAYQKDGSVYFRVLSFAQYGQLSKQKIKDLDSGSRVEIDECKENPLDFALWKRDDIVGFQSPWGMGRPGWHIECSAMAHDIFQGSIDIHGGGMDLMFPHHENEIAQSESLYPEPFVKYWLHNAFVRINKEKMSKSLNNFFTLQEVFEKFDPMVVRFYFLKHHYRGPLDFSFQDLISTQTAYKRIVDFFAETQEAALSLTEQDFVVSRMLECLKDDLNTSGVFGVLFESLPLLQKDNKSKSLVKSFLVNVLGLTLAPMIHKEVEITPEIQLLLDQRDIARQEKDWALSDQLRLKLEQLGVAIQDKKLK
ncbi:MAG: cysteine--tRNA ligase [Candidatus Dependentiae bacterium]|nr:cysteine--tRNA ligase [Candidatus Dependentiae bacterium]